MSIIPPPVEGSETGGQETNPNEGTPPPEGGTPGERPDWLPEDAWDAETGAPKLDALETLIAGAGKDSDLPAEATAYAPPEIEGLEAEAITSNVTYQTMSKLAHQLGVGQAKFADAAKVWIEEAMTASEAAAADVKKQLGADADQRLQAIANWAGPKLEPAEFAALQETFTTVEGVKAIEKLMLGGAPSAPRSAPAAPTGRKTKDEIDALMRSDAYMGPPEKRDPKVIAEVTAWFEAEHGKK